MSLRPLHCDHCGSTRLQYVTVAVDDEVAVCGLCLGVTEFPDEVTSERASEELVTQLEQLRQRRSALEEGRARPTASRRRGGPLVITWLMVAVVALVALGLLASRELLPRPSGATDRLDVGQAHPPRPHPAEAPLPAEDPVPSEPSGE